MGNRWVMGSIGCAAAALLLAADLDPSVAPANTKVEEFRVATWNTFLLPAFLEGGGMVRQSDPTCRATEGGRYLDQFAADLDLVGLQEVFDPSLQKQLVANMPKFAWVDGPRPLQCERAGPCALQSGGLTLVGNQRIQIGKTVARGYAHCRGADCLANKGFLYAPVRLAGASRPSVHLLLTHLQASGGAAGVRERQLDEIREFLEPIACDKTSPPVPVLLLGDLNTAHVLSAKTSDSENEGYRHARERLRLRCLGAPRDVFEQGSKHQGRARGTKNCSGGLLPSPCRRPTSERRLDHIWYWPAGNRMQLQDADVDAGETKHCKTQYLSDHRLVWARFSIKP